MALLSAPVAAQGATATRLAGTVTAAGKPLANAKVTLFAASRLSPTQLGQATTDASGAFSVSYTAPSSGVLYVDATPATRTKLRLRTVVGVVGSTLPTTVTVNELTT